MMTTMKGLWKGAVAAAVFVAVSPGWALAQNLTGIVPAETRAQEEAFEEVSLTPVDRVSEFSTQGEGEIPDFIQEFSHYTLGKEDQIQITVMRHPEVSGLYIVNNEGKVQYDFVGDVQVEGMTKEEVKNHLVKRLEQYIISPEVTVKIVGYNSKIVYVIGEVGAPGKIFMRGDTITVREALMQAGLPLLSAKASKSFLITPSEDGNPAKKNVNIHKLLYEGDLRENLVMNPGDTLYIPPTFLAKTMRVIQPVAQPVTTAAGAGRTVVAPF